MSSSLCEFEGPGYRAVTARIQGFRSEGDSEPPILFGHFAVFNQPTEIQSFMEGNFVERFVPRAFKKTIEDHNNSSLRDSIKCCFEHGFDLLAGNKPLGPIQELREDAEGVYYEVPLMVDALYVQEILPGLRQNLFGASFCFRSVQETFQESVTPSAANPKGLPERSITEAAVSEFGPVVFPAYSGASAGIRSNLQVALPCVSLTDRIALKAGRVSDEQVEEWTRKDPKRMRSLLSESQTREAVPYKKTPTTEEAWDGPENRKNLPSPLSVGAAREAFAWMDESRIEDGNIPKDACKFIHHVVAEDGTVGDADTQACSTGIGVLNGEMQGTTIPDDDRQGVYDHLAHHLTDAGKEPAELKARSAEPVSGESRADGGEEAISALVAAGFSEESVAEALDVNALRKDSSEPPAEGTPKPPVEGGSEQDPGADRADALLGAEGSHSDGSRDIGMTNESLPPWREDDRRVPPWHSQKG